MASSDKFGCTSATEEAGAGGSWGGPSGATGTDTTTQAWHYATVASPGSKWLICTGFSFAIPSGATIDGFLVYIYARCGGGSGTFFDAQMVSGGSRVGTAKQCPNLPYSANMYYLSVGGSSDLWGTTGLTDSNINASNFGVAIQLPSRTGNSGTKCLASVGIITYYTVASGGPSPFYIDSSSLAGGFQSLGFNRLAHKWPYWKTSRRESGLLLAQAG